MTRTVVRQDLFYNDGTQASLYSPPQPAFPRIWMHKEDQNTDVFDSGVRTCASQGCPAVFVLKEPALKVQITKDWQYYHRAINYGMTVRNVFLLHDDTLAFCNQTGFDNLDNPRRKDYYYNRTNYLEYPKFDKDRICSRNLLTGVPTYSLVTALKEIVVFVKQTMRAKRTWAEYLAFLPKAFTTNNVLRVLTMNGNNPPLMKPGKALPQSLEAANFEDYLYNPRDHRWMFIVANTVKIRPSGNPSVFPFPRGATYPWTGDGFLYSFLPIVSREEILYPLRHLLEIDSSQPFPSPYRVGE